jgi:hypothetical protein
MTTPHTPDVRAEALAVVAYLVTGLVRGEPSICFEDERGDYGDEDHTPVFDALVRLTDHESDIKARDAEIERLRGALSAILSDSLDADSETNVSAALYAQGVAAIDQARATGGETANG